MRLGGIIAIKTGWTNVVRQSPKPRQNTIPVQTHPVQFKWPSAAGQNPQPVRNNNNEKHTNPGHLVESETSSEMTHSNE